MKEIAIFGEAMVEGSEMEGRGGQSVGRRGGLELPAERSVMGHWWDGARAGNLRDKCSATEEWSGERRRRGSRSERERRGGEKREGKGRAGRGREESLAEGRGEQTSRWGDG